jgi:zinc transport system ATP-binding protein
MSTVIEFQDVSFSFGGPPVLESVDLSVTPGEFLGVVGPNGSGKTTLLRLVLGLLEPDRGRVLVLGGAPAETRHRVGYVPQFARFRRDFPLNVEQMVLMGRLGPGVGPGGWRRNDREAARQAMADLEIGDLGRRPIATLSGGQLQRALVARALTSDPEILLLDEPTANVDFRLEERLFQRLKALTERCTVLVVSHDVGFISSFVSRVACVNRHVETHTPAGMTGETIETLYGTPVQMVHRAHHHQPGENER